MSNLLGGRNQTKLLLACCAVGAPLFVATALIEGAGRAGYEPIREPVSALALGERGWIQRANFVGTGLAMLAGASGLRRSSSARAGSSWGPRLVGAYAVGLIGAGLFTMDPIVIGSATRSDDADLGHVLHDAFSLVVFGALTGTCFVYARDFVGRGKNGWAIYSAATGMLVASGVVLFGRGFAGSRQLAPVAGVIQRLTIITGWGWVARLAASEFAGG